MFGFLAKLLAGPIVGKVVDLFKIWKQGKIDEAELRAEVEHAVLNTIADVAKTQGDIIMSEMHGENWLQRNWRPIVAVSLSFIIFFYGIISPVMVAWFDFAPVRVGDQLLSWIMDAVKICLGGYIVGRSFEKIVKSIVNR